MFKRFIGMILGKEKKDEYYELMKKKDFIAVGQQFGKTVYFFSVNRLRRKRILNQLAKEGNLDVVAQLYSIRKQKKAKVLAAQYAEYQSAKPNKAFATGKYFLRRAIRSGLTWVLLALILIYACITPLFSNLIRTNTMKSRMQLAEQYA